MWDRAPRDAHDISSKNQAARNVGSTNRSGGSTAAWSFRASCPNAENHHRVSIPNATAFPHGPRSRPRADYRHPQRLQHALPADGRHGRVTKNIFRTRNTSFSVTPIPRRIPGDTARLCRIRAPLGQSAAALLVADLTVQAAESILQLQIEEPELIKDTPHTGIHSQTATSAIYNGAAAFLSTPPARASASHQLEAMAAEPPWSRRTPRRSPRSRGEGEPSSSTRQHLLEIADALVHRNRHATFRAEKSPTDSNR